MDVPTDSTVSWRPAVAGVAEVFHARWHDHAYPAHTHDTWTLLVVDDGVIGYDLDRHDHTAVRSGVTLLPPHVVHDGRALTAGGFRKRVVYLEEDVIAPALVGRAVDAPLVPDAELRRAVSLLDHALVARDDLEAESRLALVVERLTDHLVCRLPETASTAPSARGQVARRVGGGRAAGRAAGRVSGRVAALAREVFDADPVGTDGVAAVASSLGVTTPHLVRSFVTAYGIAPHQYVVGRRLDLARRRLRDGVPAALVATETGFYDQAHLTRHFKRFLGTTPARYQRSA